MRPTKEVEEKEPDVEPREEVIRALRKEGRTPRVNGWWREWISWQVREKSVGGRIWETKVAWPPAWFNKYLLFSSFVGGDVRYRNTAANLQMKVGDTGPLEA